MLRKEPMSREVEDSDEFHFNDQFQSKLFKIKIGTITATKESEPEKQETRQKVLASCFASQPVFLAGDKCVIKGLPLD